MKEQNEGQFLKDENHEMNQAETPEKLVESAQIQNHDTPIIRESEEERIAQIEAKRSEAIENASANKNNTWSGAAFNQSNQPAEEFDPKVVHMPIPEKHQKSGLGWLGKLAFSLGLTGIAASAMAKDKSAEKEFVNTGDTKEKTISDSMGHEKPVDKITSINSYGEKVGNLTLEGELLVPYSDTTKQVALIKFSGKENDPNAIANIIEAAHKKGYKLGLSGMLERTIVENPALVKLLDKNRMYVASLGEQFLTGDDTRAETTINAKTTTDTLVNTQGDTSILTQTRVYETKPEIDAIVTYVPGVHKINRNEDRTTIGYDYAIIVYRDLLPENTAVYTDGLTKK